MSNQKCILSFFNVSKSPNQEKTTRKSILSLKKPSTPSKPPTTPNDLPKTSRELPTTSQAQQTTEEVILVQRPEEIINLLSESDDEPSPPKIKKEIFPRTSKSLHTPKAVQERSQHDSPQVSQDLFASSSSQEIPQTFNCSTESIVCDVSPGNILQTPKTPTKTPRTPGSKTKFYSPTKKRCLTKKTPAKRNLTFTDTKQGFTGAENDDKTSFLLSIIYKFLKTDGLKNLLEEKSQELLQKCFEVQYPGMKLVCRLYWRQESWYSIEELEKIAEDKNITEIINYLIENGFIALASTECEPIMELDDYLKVLRKPKLDEICKQLKLKKNTKQDAVAELKAYCKLSPISNFYTGAVKVKTNKSRVLKMLQSIAGNCYKLTDFARTTLYNLYVLMYLGIDYTIIRDKKLEYMLILDKTKEEPYPVDKAMEIEDASVVFQDKDEFYRYLQAHRIYEDYLAKQGDMNERCRIIKQTYNLYKEIDEQLMLRYKSLPIWLRRFTPANIYVKLLEKGVHDLKSLHTEEHYKFAVDILDTLIGQIAFRNHKKAEWYAEKALILHKHLDSAEMAAKVLLKGFESDLPEQQTDLMRPRARMIANQQNLDLKETLRDELRAYANKNDILESSLPAEHIYKQPADNYNSKGKLKFEAFTSSGRTTLTAEDYCVYHYENEGQYTHGYHWEGRLASTLFFVLFWDIIYSKPRGVTGIFMSHFQRYPLDMFCDSFYINRKTLIDERLIAIAKCTDDELVNMLRAKWEEKPKCVISDVSIEWEPLQHAAGCLRARGVCALSRRLAEGYAHCRSGFPDLTLWNVHTKQIKFLEVKTDADKPSVKQLQWLQYLTRHALPAGFCYVGGNTTRSRARARDSAASSREHSQA